MKQPSVSRFLALLSDALVGLPAGLLMFMSVMAVSALLRQRGTASSSLELLILALSALAVGGLIRITRKQRAFSTALAGGIVSAGVLLYLWLAAPHNAALNPLVFGLPGIALCLLLPPVIAYR